MITVERILFLRSVGLFTGLPARELGRVAAIAEEVVTPAGTTIVREGEYGDCMFVIVDGSVSITRGNQRLAQLGERDYFGEMSILDGEPRSASAVAETDCLLLRIDQSEFHEILARHFDATLIIIRTLCSRLRSQMERTDDPEARGNG